jgi:hypothetical protein
MFKDNSANNITIIKMPSRMISEEYYIYEWYHDPKIPL